MPTKTELEPFLGGAGNVKYDPYTGKQIPYEDRVKPGQYRRQQAMETSWDLATGPALQEASNFKFQDLPASIMQQGGAYDQLMGNGAYQEMRKDVLDSYSVSSNQSQKMQLSLWLANTYFYSSF
jgi:hypothetical protein